MVVIDLTTRDHLLAIPPPDRASTQSQTKSLYSKNLHHVTIPKTLCTTSIFPFLHTTQNPSTMPPPPPHRQRLQEDEETPLLQSTTTTSSISSSSRSRSSITSQETQQIKFSADGDADNPRTWSPRKKMTNVAIIALMSILSPLASSMFAPGISQIAADLHTDEQSVIATTTGFVICLGLGPLFLAPLSETFGRRALYIGCFAVFTVLQAASALAPGIGVLVAVRTVSGLFGSEYLPLFLCFAVLWCRVYWGALVIWCTESWLI